MIAVTYLGPKPQREIEFPVPLLALSDRTGERVTFVKDVPQPIARHLAEQLRAFPEVFHVEPALEQGSPPPAPTPTVDRKAEALEKALTKRFAGKRGKWDAKAYVTRHKLGDAVDYKNTVYGWTLVLKPITPITPHGVGQEDSNGRDHDSGGDGVGNGRDSEPNTGTHG